MEEITTTELHKKEYTLAHLNKVQKKLDRYEWKIYCTLLFPRLPYYDGIKVCKNRFFSTLRRKLPKGSNIFWFYKSTPSNSWYVQFFADIPGLKLQTINDLWFSIACRKFPGYKRFGRAVKIKSLDEKACKSKKKRVMSYVKWYCEDNDEYLNIPKGETYGFIHK
jgi:hypothetical protein